MDESLKFFVTLGVGGTLAWGMFLVYRKDAKEAADRWREQTSIMVQVVKENTEAITELIVAVRALTK